MNIFIVPIYFCSIGLFPFVDAMLIIFFCLCFLFFYYCNLSSDRKICVPEEQEIAGLFLEKDFLLKWCLLLGLD